MGVMDKFLDALHLNNEEEYYDDDDFYDEGEIIDNTATANFFNLLKIGLFFSAFSTKGAIVINPFTQILGNFAISCTSTMMMMISMMKERL